MSKIEGAKLMFDQAVIYLLNGYREEGYSKEESAQKVVEHIAEVYAKYHRQKALPTSPKLFDPVRLVDEIMQDLRWLDTSQKVGPLRSIKQKLLHLKSVLGGR